MTPVDLAPPTGTPVVPVIPWRGRATGGAVPAPRTTCLGCRMKGLCLAAGLGPGVLGLLDGLVAGRRRVRTGQCLFLEGEKFQSLYTVRNGSFKLSTLLRCGRDQVTQFALAGDLLGLDGLARGAHGTTAAALEDSEVCSIPIADLHALSARNPQWQETLCRRMGQEIVRENRHLLLLGSGGTEGRLATFLLELSDAMAERGYSATEFHLRMSRAEIGSYLGLTLETVSRTLSTFRQRGLLDVRKRHIRIRALDALRRVRDDDGV
jgi:CRP/FNR family transcriptional regulator